MRLILDGKANTLHNAEEMYLDASLAEIFRLIASEIDNETLLRHPLMQLLASHDSQEWEDSLL